MPFEEVIGHCVIKMADLGVAIQPFFSIGKTWVLDLFQYFLNQFLATAAVFTFTVRFSQGSIDSVVYRSS